MTKPLGIIKKFEDSYTWHPYVATLIVLQNNVVDYSYFMLLGNLGSKMQRLHMTEGTM
jgi:hypothetical protein